MTNLVRDEDRDFYERELASFIPDRVFDAHTHLWHADHCYSTNQFEKIRSTVGLREYKELMEDLHPGRDLSALLIPYGTLDNLHQASEWLANEMKADASYRGLFFVKAGDDPEWVREQVRRLGLHGLKCYHSTASIENTYQAEIPQFLPESFIKVADEEGWVITLHMVRDRAAADPSNIRWIRHYCENYPNMTLILAHSARGFQPSHNLEGLPHLTGLPNLYFDSSANCEATAHEAIIRIIGHDKLMYGSDLPVTHMRGRSVAAADSFLWLYEESPVWGEKHFQIHPVLIGLEHLRSIKWACWSTGMTDGQVEDIFWNNAARLFGLQS